MRKYYTPIHEAPIEAGRRSRVPFLAGLALVVLVSPFLYEFGLVVYAQWRSMTGTYWVPSTPRLDALREWGRTADLALRYHASRVFNSGPWSPSLAVPFGIGWAVAMAVVFLRRVR